MNERLKQNNEIRGSTDVADLIMETQLERAKDSLQENLQPTLESEGQVSKRFGSLRRTFDIARNVALGLRENFAIEHDGYRLSVSENILARFVRPLGGFDRTFADTPIVEHFKERAYDRQEKRFNTSETMTKKEMAVTAAYELMTLATVRTMGLAALNGAANFVVDKAVAGTRTKHAASMIGRVTERSLSIHDKGLHNPGIRSAKGYTQRAVRREYGSIKQTIKQQ